MRTAFKEWAVIVDALGHGDQILILRKGGIAEGRGGFQVEHAAFALFPTRFHQQRESVTAAAQARYDRLATAWPPEDRVRIEYVAQVVEWRKLNSLDDARRLESLHVWRPEVIAERFDWGREQAIHALALRIARLPAAVELPMIPAYGGCRTWIELERDLPAADARPVLDEEAFAARLAQFQQALPL